MRLYEMRSREDKMLREEKKSRERREAKKKRDAKICLDWAKKSASIY